MYALDFEYAGEKLSDYGMMLCHFDSTGMETVSSGADITFHQMKPNGRNNFMLYGRSYEGAYSTTFQICKNPETLDAADHKYLTLAEISALQRWLCRREYHEFKIHQEDFEAIHWNAVFFSKQILYRGQIVGLELTMYTDAPYAYLDAVNIQVTCTAGFGFDIYDISDEEGYIYPDITITLLADEQADNDKTTFTLHNSADNRTTSIDNCSIGETITFNGKNQTILSTSESHSATLARDFNYIFPRIGNSYNDTKNTFTCNCNCNITLSYSPIRKVGL